MAQRQDDADACLPGGIHWHRVWKPERVGCTVARMAEGHLAAALPERRRIDYLAAVAAMAYADCDVAEVELVVLRRLAGELGLERAAFARVEEAIRRPVPERVDAVLKSFSRDPCKYALLADAMLVALADRRVTVEEFQEADRFARRLGVPMTKVVLIARYVQRVLSTDREDRGHPERTRTLLAGLAHAAARVHSPYGVKKLYRKLLGARKKK